MRIGLSDRISTVAPKLVTMAKVDQAPVPLVGVRWPDEMRVKGYWATDGSFPELDNEVLVGVDPGDRNDGIRFAYNPDTHEVFAVQQR